MKLKHHLFLLILTMFISGGCAAITGNTRLDPDNIVIRNGSGKNLRVVTLRAVTKAKSEGIRYGSISPVPQGANQAVTRPTTRPPLPDTMVMEWLDERERGYSRQINLKGFLEQEKTNEAKTLVFKILPSGEVSLMLE